MDPEIKKVLDEVHALTRDTHRMVRAIRRDQWISFAVKVIVWAGLIFLPIYFYQQYLQPYITKFTTPTTSSPNSFDVPSSAVIQKLIDSYKAGQQ